MINLGILEDLDRLARLVRMISSDVLHHSTS